MIKIGVFSDSHGHKEALEQAIAHAGPLDLVIHCGDGSEDLISLFQGTDTPYIAVRGNCDLKGRVPDQVLHKIAEHSIMVVHGHQYDVKFDYTRLFYKAEETGANIVLFGHTHVAEIIENRGIIMMNPGSVVRPSLGQKPSYGLIEIEHNIPNCRIINFG